MSSTFLTRLRIGEILVDAKGVSRLYRPRPGVDAAALRDRRRPDRDARRGVDDPRAARRCRTAVAAAAAAAAARARLSARPGSSSRDDRLPLPRALPRRRPVRARAGRAARRGDRRLEPRLLGQERHRPQPRGAKSAGARRQAAPAPGSALARTAVRRRACYPLAVHGLLAGPQRRPRVPGRVL